MEGHRCVWREKIQELRAEIHTGKSENSTVEKLPPYSDQKTFAEKCFWGGQEWRTFGNFGSIGNRKKWVKIWWIVCCVACAGVWEFVKPYKIIKERSVKLKIPIFLLLSLSTRWNSFMTAIYHRQIFFIWLHKISLKILVNNTK